MFMNLKYYKVSVYGISDKGLVRSNNEDFWTHVHELDFVVLTDGMGGHRAGEVAAREAAKALCEHLQQTLAIAGPSLSIDEAHGLIQLSIEHANHTVYELSKAEKEWRGMGTTLCCLLCHPQGIIYAHVGDSRIYRLHNARLRQLTKDHSLLRELVDLGQVNERSKDKFIYKNIITKAVGTEKSVEPSVHISDVAKNDIYLMCSDGLTDMLSTKEIESVLNNIQNIEVAARILVAKANAKGGHDNITLVIIKIDETRE
jgi:protein phosphatase